MDLIGQITNLENLYWAWEKAKHFYATEDAWYDEMEVAKFEANLDEELKLIRHEIKAGEYILSPLKPVAFPKAPQEDGPKTRQAFLISIRDQVSWIAVINIIGQWLEYKMPFWSYAYRLHIPVFYEMVNKKKELKFGRYRSSSKLTYRTWRQTWPLYRRHISITSKIMLRNKLFRENINKFKDEELDHFEEETLEQNRIVHDYLKVAYLDRDYWDKPLSGKVYWARLDLRKFYPSVNPNIIRNNIKQYLPQGVYTEPFDKLLTDLLHFNVDYSDWNSEELMCVELGEATLFSGIPTGLFVAGFLSNVAMLQIDEIVNQRLKNDKTVAHFRFVDDYVILTADFDNLCNWLYFYKDLLEKNGLSLNLEKIEPIEFEKLLINPRSKIKKKAKIAAELDPNFPAPLMTQTLAKLSNIVRVDLALLDEKEENQLFADLEHLLLADIPDHEIRKDTRVAFASNKLARLAPSRVFTPARLLTCDKEINCLLNDPNLNQDLELQLKLKAKENEKAELLVQKGEEETKLRKHIYKLLRKATGEHHQKLRLWARLIEFCRRMGEIDFRHVFELLNSIQANGKCNDLCAGYIYAYILKTFSEQMIISYKILSSSKISNTNRIRNTKFLQGILNQKFLELLLYEAEYENKVYIQKALQCFKITLGFIIWANTEELEGKFVPITTTDKLIMEFDIIDWRKPHQYIAKTDHSLCEWGWWIIRKISDENSSKPRRFWYLLTKHIIADEMYTNDQWPILALYPNSLSSDILNKVLAFNTNNDFLSQSSEGWLYEVISNNLRTSYLENERLVAVQRVVFLEKERKDSISLFEWVRQADQYWLHLLEKEEWIFDPRLSEWTALEIVRQIAELYQYDLEDQYKVHPANYLVPKSWIIGQSQIPSWEQWIRTCTKRNNKIKFKEPEELISDFRYTPEIEDPYSCSNNEMALISGLCSLLIGLLLRDFELPPYWNLRGTQKVWSYAAKQRIIEYPISSRTLGIIESCFSRRNRGTAFLKALQLQWNLQQPLFEDIDDTICDPPEIEALDAFIDNIRKAQKILRNYQVNIQDNRPRQLIPISLIQLTRSSNVYQGLEEDE